MPNLEYIQQSHVPCVVIILQLKELWKAEHEGKLPSNFAEKQLFKQFIKDHCKKIYNGELQYQLSENFKEASEKAMLMYSNNEDEDTLEVLNDPRCNDPKCGGTIAQSFWVYCSALKQFHDKEGRLPLNGTIPDMTSTPEYFIALQHVYRNKALADVDTMKLIITDVLNKLGCGGKELVEE